ncbi:MAG: DUF6531 domain-containing protein [Gemmatimonadaceae bacterium]
MKRTRSAELARRLVAALLAFSSALAMTLVVSRAEATETAAKLWEYNIYNSCIGYQYGQSADPGLVADAFCYWLSVDERPFGCSVEPPHFQSPNYGGSFTFEPRSNPGEYPGYWRFDFHCTKIDPGYPFESAGSVYLVGRANHLKDKGKCSGDGAPSCDMLLGEPIHVASGNKFEEFTLFREPSHVTGAALVLYYNSASVPGDVTGFGSSWSHTYQRVVNVGIAVVGDATVQIGRADGAVYAFAKSGSEWVGDSDVAIKLVELVAGGATTGWQVINADDDSVETYDASGKLLSLKDRAGNETSLTYSDANTPPEIAPAAGMLLAVTNQVGKQIQFHYSGAGSHISAVTDPAGNTYSFTYSAEGNIASISFPDAHTRTFLYNEPENIAAINFQVPPAIYKFGALTGIIDENGQRYSTTKYLLNNTWPNAGPMAYQTELAGGADRSTVSYSQDPTAIANGGSYSVATADALGTARTVSYTSVVGRTHATQVSQPCSSCQGLATETKTYDEDGNVTSRIDWNGNRTNYSYDTIRILELSRTEGLTAAGGTTPQTRTTSTQWDANFRFPTAVAEPLKITTSVYDPDGTLCGARGALCSKTIQATTDTNGSQAFSAPATGAPRTWAYTYNANGSVLTMNGPRTDVPDVTTYTYYANDDADFGKRGNVATITNALGQVTSITSYNLHGQPLTIVDPNGLTTTLAYDPRQRLTSRSVGTETTAYEYDSVGQLTKITLPDSSYLTYSYDAAHRMTGMQDNLGNHIAYTLDAMGNLTQEQVFDPASTLAQTRSRVFNNLNRLFQEIGAASQTTQYAYDNQGNVTSVTDPLTKVSTNAYDALNRLRQVTDPALGVTQYGYNGLDALTSVTDPKNLTTGYTVDGLGNLTLQASPDTGNTANTYDAAGNLLSQTDAKAQTTSYAYDALNRVTLITFQDDSKQAYAYDQSANGLGRLSTITETDSGSIVTSLIAYGYDQHGRVTSETRTLGGHAYVTAYSYDASGRMDGMTYPSGRTVAYTFDALGRVNQITTTKPGDSPQVVVQNVAYHPFGGVTGFTFGNGQTYARTVDQDGRIAAYTLGGASFAIAFDAASRITGITETTNPSNANTYGYDALDRLTSAVLPSSSYGYSYDGVGNRLTKTVGAATDTYAYSPTSNRIASIAPASGGSRSFTFDANGSTVADGNNNYAYDSRGRMVQAVSAVGTTGYQVNALGQRVRKTNSTGDTVFTYDTRGRLIEESDPGGTVKREYLYLGDIPVSVVQ